MCCIQYHHCLDISYISCWLSRWWCSNVMGELFNASWYLSVIIKKHYCLYLIILNKFRKSPQSHFIIMLGGTEWQFGFLDDQIFSFWPYHVAQEIPNQDQNHIPIRWLHVVLYWTSGKSHPISFMSHIFLKFTKFFLFTDEFLDFMNASRIGLTNNWHTCYNFLGKHYYALGRHYGSFSMPWSGSHYNRLDYQWHMRWNIFSLYMMFM